MAWWPSTAIRDERAVNLISTQSETWRRKTLCRSITCVDINQCVISSRRREAPRKKLISSQSVTTKGMSSAQTLVTSAFKRLNLS